MRFKFRAWDKERNEMRMVELMDWSDWWVSTGSTWERDEPLAFGERNSFNNEQTDRHILMQYTGLKDKNGKEIYEGDIVEYNGGTTESRSKMEVKWCDASYQLKAFKEHWCYELGECLQDSLEIIGNIYENPELLITEEDIDIAIKEARNEN